MRLYVNGVQPKHLWPMDGSDGAILSNIISPQFNGALFGPTRTSGVDVGGLSFDGLDDYVSLNVPAMTGDWSAALWVYPKAVKNDAVLLGSSTHALKLQQWPSSGQVGLTAFGQGDYSFNYAAPLNDWTHLTFISEGGQTTLFVNCLPVQSLPITIPLPAADFGRDARGGGYLNARTDQLSLFDRALMDNEVQSLCGYSTPTLNDQDGDGTPDDQDAFPNDPTETTDSDADGTGDNSDPYPFDPSNGINPLNATYYWPMDFNDDIALLQVISPSNTLSSLHGAVRVSGFQGGGLHFDGVDDYVSLSTAQTFSGDWTASIWVNPKAIENDAVLLGSSTHALKLQQWPSSGQVGLTAFGVGDYYYNYSAPLNDWTHLTFVTEAGQTKLYANCTYVDSLSTTFNLPLSNLGRDVRGGGHLNALTDELKIFDRALQEPEIESLCATIVSSEDDQDGDGVPDELDAFPNDPTESMDSDADGTGDNADPYPFDPTNGANPLNAKYFWPMDSTDPNQLLEVINPMASGGLIDGASRELGYQAGGIAFDGLNDYVSLNKPSLTGDWTLSMWVKPNTVVNDAVLLGSSSHALKLQQWPSTGQLGFTAFGVGDYYFNYSVGLNTWTHLTLVSESGQTKLYANCAYVQTLANTIPLPLDVFGRDARGGGHLSAATDLLKVFDRSLQESEILTLCE